jgi:hypothetical protein
MVKVILRSLVFRNPTQVQLIRGDPRYKLMSPEEVVEKFVSFELMIKGSKQIVEQGGTSTPLVQPIAFKATEEKKEESTSSRLPIDASKLNNEEMTVIIKSFRQILKQRKEKDYKPRSKKVCYNCGKPGHFIAKYPLSSDSVRDDDKKGKRKEKKRYYKKKGGDAHVCRELDSDESSTDSSSNEDATNIAVNKGLLFPNVGHKCLMAKDDKNKKVKSRASTKYTTSSDCHITGVDGRMADPGIASACLDGAWMTVVGLGGIASGAGGEHRAARVDAERMGRGGGEASGQGMGGGDDLGPRQVGGGGMIMFRGMAGGVGADMRRSCGYGW